MNSALGTKDLVLITLEGNQGSDMVGLYSQQMSFGLLSHWRAPVELKGLAMSIEVPECS